MPSLHAPTVPPGWRLLTGPSLAVLAEIDDTDERLPHLHAAVGSGRFDDALLVLGRSGGPPSCAAAAITATGAVRIVVAKAARAEVLVGGRQREIRPSPELGWADVVLDDAVGVALLVGAADGGPVGMAPPSVGMPPPPLPAVSPPPPAVSPPPPAPPPPPPPPPYAVSPPPPPAGFPPPAPPPGMPPPPPTGAPAAAAVPAPPQLPEAPAAPAAAFGAMPSGAGLEFPVAPTLPPHAEVTPAPQSPPPPPLPAPAGPPTPSAGTGPVLPPPMWGAPPPPVAPPPLPPVMMPPPMDEPPAPMNAPPAPMDAPPAPPPAPVAPQWSGGPDAVPAPGPAIIDRLPWEQPGAPTTPAVPPAVGSASAPLVPPPPMPIGGWVPASPPIPIGRPHTPYAAPLPPASPGAFDGGASVPVEDVVAVALPSADNADADGADVDGADAESSAESVDAAESLDAEWDPSTPDQPAAAAPGFDIAGFEEAPSPVDPEPPELPDLTIGPDSPTWTGTSGWIHPGESDPAWPVPGDETVAELPRSASPLPADEAAPADDAVPADEAAPAAEPSPQPTETEPEPVEPEPAELEPEPAEPEPGEPILPTIDPGVGRPGWVFTGDVRTDMLPPLLLEPEPAVEPEPEPAAEPGPEPEPEPEGQPEAEAEAEAEAEIEPEPAGASGEADTSDHEGADAAYLPQQPTPEPADEPVPAAEPMGYEQPSEGWGEPQDPDAFDLTVDRAALLAEAGMSPILSGVSVLAVLCPAGHVTPPHAGQCRTCGLAVPAQEPFSTPRPPLGVLRLSSGDVVALDRGVLLGRAPKVDPDQPVAARPHVVKVASPLRDVSRNHLEVILEGWHVMVRDLATTNGTTVTLPGRAPVRLLAHDQQVIEPGTVVSLADEVSFTFELGE